MRPSPCVPQLDLVRRQTTFDEVVQGLTEQTALFEPAAACPAATASSATTATASVLTMPSIKLGPGKKFRINYEYCKGCGICANECPCGAIDMVPESI